MSDDATPPGQLSSRSSSVDDSRKGGNDWKGKEDSSGEWATEEEERIETMAGFANAAGSVVNRFTLELHVSVASNWKGLDQHSTHPIKLFYAIQKTESG